MYILVKKELNKHLIEHINKNLNNQFIYKNIYIPFIFLKLNYNDVFNIFTNFNDETDILLYDDKFFDNLHIIYNYVKFNKTITDGKLLQIAKKLLEIEQTTKLEDYCLIFLMSIINSNLNKFDMVKHIDKFQNIIFLDEKLNDIYKDIYPLIKYEKTDYCMENTFLQFLRILFYNYSNQYIETYNLDLVDKIIDNKYIKLIKIILDNINNKLLCLKKLNELNYKSFFEFCENILMDYNKLYLNNILKKINEDFDISIENDIIIIKTNITRRLSLRCFDIDSITKNIKLEVNNKYYHYYNLIQYLIYLLYKNKLEDDQLDFINKLLSNDLIRYNIFETYVKIFKLDNCYDKLNKIISLWKNNHNNLLLWNYASSIRSESFWLDVAKDDKLLKYFYNSGLSKMSIWHSIIQNVNYESFWKIIGSKKDIIYDWRLRNDFTYTIWHYAVKYLDFNSFWDLIDEKILLTWNSIEIHNNTIWNSAFEYIKYDKFWKKITDRCLETWTEKNIYRFTIWHSAILLLKNESFWLDLIKNRTKFIDYWTVDIWYYAVQFMKYNFFWDILAETDNFYKHFDKWTYVETRSCWHYAANNIKSIIFWKKIVDKPGKYIDKWSEKDWYAQTVWDIIKKNDTIDYKLLQLNI